MKFCFIVLKKSEDLPLPPQKGKCFPLSRVKRLLQFEAFVKQRAVVCFSRDREGPAVHGQQRAAPARGARLLILQEIQVAVRGVQAHLG